MSRAIPEPSMVNGFSPSFPSFLTSLSPFGPKFQVLNIELTVLVKGHRFYWIMDFISTGCHSTHALFSP